MKIPPGIESGAKLRLRGQGEAGEKGAPRGDLTILVTVEPHPYFTPRGRNLPSRCPITVGEAVLGAKVDVPDARRPEVADRPAGQLQRR